MGNLRLFVACVAIWGSTWLAIKYQLGKVAPEASVAYRYLVASTILFVFCVVRGHPLRFTLRQHCWIFLFGAITFCVSYIFVYHAEIYLVSGLVAVGYSASPLLNAVGARVFFGTRMTRRVIAGSILGIVGITLVFWPEFAHVRADGATAVGAVLTALSVVLSSLGNMAAHHNNNAKIPFWGNLAWGMLYGSLLSFAATVAMGKPLDFEATPGYVISLLYLAVLGSVVAFACYFTLMHRIGPARAGYIGVMVPIVALVISAAFEGFHWAALTWLGVAVSVAGNVIILRRV